MKKIRIAAVLLAAVLVASAFAGCGETKTQTADSSSVKQEQPAAQNERGTMAKIVSLDGDQLTVILANMPDGGDGRVHPANGTPPAMGSQPDSGAAPPSGGNGPGQGGQGGGEIQFTGEQATYTLSKDIKITKGTGDNSAEIDLSELAADDVVTFTTAAGDDGGEVIDSLQVLDRIN